MVGEKTTFEYKNYLINVSKLVHKSHEKHKINQKIHILSVLILSQIIHE